MISTIITIFNLLLFTSIHLIFKKCKRAINRSTSHLWLNTDSNIFLKSECLRLIVYFLWHYDTAAVTFHSSFVRPTFSAFYKLIYICNQLKCGGEKRKRWRNQKKCEQQVLFVASHILHWRVFFIFLDLLHSRFVLLQLINISRS